MLPLGQCDLDKGAVLTPGVDDGKRIRTPIPGYLIRTVDGQHILVDTGMNIAHVDDPDHTFRGRPQASVLHPVMRESDYVVHRLSELSLRPADIDIVINTHFHFDHCGGNRAFPRARFIVQREHYEQAIASDNFPRADFDLPGLQYDLIDGELELLPGITLTPTPGHVPAHQSLLIEPRDGRAVVLCIDAIYTLWNLELDNWLSQPDPIEAKASAVRLVELARAKDALLIFGHDPQQWGDLRLSPAYYPE